MKRILDALDALVISYEMITHPAISTIDEMKAVNLPHTQDIVKNLFLRDDKKRNYYLVSVENDKRIDLKALSKAIPSRPLSFASDHDLQQYLQLGKGEVTPIAIVNDRHHRVHVILDNDLRSHDLIGIHPMMNTAMVYMKLSDFERLMKHFEHEITYIHI